MTWLTRLNPWRYAGLVLLTRLLMLAGLWVVTGAHELSNDTSMHMGMVREPLSVLLGTHPGYEQNPPFLPFLETIVGYPLQLFCSDFISLRLVMIVYESILSGVFCLLLARLGLSDRQRLLCLAAYLVLPMGWMTSVVMAQDEVIAAAAFLLPLWLFIIRRPRAAILACGIGVIAGKLFIGLELLGLIALSGRGRLKSNTLLGFAPIVLVYGAMSVHRLMHALPLPLVGWRPDPSYGTNFWMLLRNYGGVDLRTAGSYSGIAALLCSLTPIAILLLRKTRETSPPSARAVAIAVNTSLLIFFSLFYHVNPEYFVMVLPLLLVSVRDATDTVATLLIATMPWVGKFFQNAAFMANAGSNTGKVVALKYYAAIFHAPAEYWLAATQACFSILTIWVSIRWCVRLATTDAPSARDAGAVAVPRL